ncbi:MAG: DUF4097 family beta strand repeat protein [Clostridia bacterium]|nr:DUF4097 family beta strand repeat protein [Clostridia bacterium]
MKKALIIIAAIAVSIGIILVMVAALTVGFNFSELIQTEKNYETKTYEINDGFRDIDIKSKNTRIVIKPSEDGKASVVCPEYEKVTYFVKVEDEVLKIYVEDGREWYDYVYLFNKSLQLTVSIPSGEYGVLTADAGTGDVDVNEAFSFGDANIKTDTGDVAFNASAENALKIKTTTGDITLKSTSAGSVDLSVTTGRIAVSSLDCRGELSAHVSTGKTELSDVTCGSLASTGSTGDIKLKNVAVSGQMSIERSTGDVRFTDSDAAQITVKTTTGDVTGTLKSEKIFVAKASTGKISVPDTASGGKCEINTSTGDIRISISGK